MSLPAGVHGHEGIDSPAGHGWARDEVEVDGLWIGYVRAGSGPPVVLVHGFVGDALSTWSRQIAALSGEYTVVAWDAPGAGRSAVPAASFRLPDYADCLAAVVRTLGLARPHVVGLSFGGALLLDLCGRRLLPARSLVVAGGYAGWAGSLPVTAARIAESSPQWQTGNNAAKSGSACRRRLASPTSTSCLRRA